MATCLQSINLMGAYLSLQVLNPSTVTPLSFTPTVNKLFRFSITQPSSLLFNINLTPSATPFMAAQATFYKWNGNISNIQLIGSVNLNNPTISFSRDFEFGNYIVCFRSLNGSYSGSVTYTASNYPTTSFMSARLSSGETLSRPQITILPLPGICEEPIFYEIIEGALPPGLTMNSLGIIEGFLPNLDCIKDTEKLSPSFNWFYQDVDGNYQPYGYRWRFKVKIYLPSYPDVAQEAWFCIKIHNNWDFDRDNFIRQAPFDRTRQIEIIKEPERLPQTVCYEPCEDDQDTVIFRPQKIQDLGCAECDAPAVDVVLIPIPQPLKKKPITEIAEWFEKYQNEIFKSKDIQEFVDRLKKTEAWKLFMAQKLMDDEEKLKSEKIITTSIVNDSLQISVLSPYRDAEELFDLVDRLRLQENQKLPNSCDISHGENITATLSIGVL